MFKVVLGTAAAMILATAWGMAQQATQKEDRPRARDLGIKPGIYDPGPLNAITDVPGIRVGHWTDAEAGTGCTAIILPPGARGGVDVRGGGPASRETDLLRPEATVPLVSAIVLSGGSAFGLDTASGVMAWDVREDSAPVAHGEAMHDARASWISIGAD